MLVSPCQAPNKTFLLAKDLFGTYFLLIARRNIAIAFRRRMSQI